MKIQKVSILGTEYTVEYCDRESHKVLEQCDGICDYTSKTIIVNSMEEFDQEKDPLIKSNMEMYRKKCVRHEIVHAFLFESGLTDNSGHADNWSDNEEMVDWIAYQFPKMLKAFQDLNVI